MVYLPSRKAAERLGLHPQTLRRYAAQDRIPFYRNAGGQRLYDVDAFLRGKATVIQNLMKSDTPALQETTGAHRFI